MNREESVRDVLKVHINTPKFFIALLSAVSAAFVTVAHFSSEGALEGLTFAVLLYCGASVLLPTIAPAATRRVLYGKRGCPVRSGSA